MTTDIHVEPPGPVAATAAPPVGPRPARRREVIYRHRLPVRLAHWVNAAAVFVLIGSGLNIFNAHPRLYWGSTGGWTDPALLAIGAHHTPQGPRGYLQLGPALRLDTTGVLGWSRVGGQWAVRAWPSWLTLPGYQDLADARHWHFLFAWLLVANGLAYLAWSLWSRHLQRDLWPMGADLRALPRSIAEHLVNRHPTGEAAKRYNVLQKLAYLALIALVLGMAVTGLAMSPGMDAALPGLTTVLGGRQSARTLHFAFATGVVGFIAVHLAQVVLAGPLNEIRSIVTGRFAVPAARPGEGEARP